MKIDINKANTPISVVILTVLFAVVAVNIKFYIDVQNELEDAQELAISGSYDEAIEIYESMLEEESLYLGSNLEEIYIGLAEGYSGLGDYESSREFYNMIIDQTEGDISSDIYQESIIVNFLVGEIETAVAIGEKALEEYPVDKDIQKTMMMMYLVTGNNTLMMELINSYDVDSELASDMVGYAKMHFMIGENEKGYAYLKEAWELNKFEIKTFDIIAQMAQFNFKIVEQDLSEKVLNTDDVFYKLALAKVYSGSKDTAYEALEILDGLEENEILSRVIVDSIRIAALQNINDMIGAKQLLDTLLDDFSDNYYVYHVGAWFYYNEENYEKALKYAQKSIELNSEYSDNYGFLLPSIYLKIGEEDKILSCYKKAIQLEPYNYNYILALSDYFYLIGDSEQAEYFYGILVDIQENSTDLRYTQSFIYLNKGEIEEAIKVLEECIDMTKRKDSEYLITLGTMYMQIGEEEQSLNIMKEAYEIDDSNSILLSNLGVYSVIFQGDIEQGIYYLDSAIEHIENIEDKEIKKDIEFNYDLICKLIEEYNNADWDEEISIPDFILFY